MKPPDLVTPASTPRKLKPATRIATILTCTKCGQTGEALELVDVAALHSRWTDTLNAAAAADDRSLYRSAENLRRAHARARRRGDRHRGCGGKVTTTRVRVPELRHIVERAAHHKRSRWAEDVELVADHRRSHNAT